MISRKHILQASRLAVLLVGGGLMTAAVFAKAEEIGQIGVDWLGNDIVVEYVNDPQVGGVTCHLAYFERGLIDRLRERQLVRGSVQFGN